MAPFLPFCHSVLPSKLSRWFTPIDILGVVQVRALSTLFSVNSHTHEQQVGIAHPSRSGRACEHCQGFSRSGTVRATCSVGTKRICSRPRYACLGLAHNPVQFPVAAELLCLRAASHNSRLEEEITISQKLLRHPPERSVFFQLLLLNFLHYFKKTARLLLVRSSRQAQTGG